jgi:hypothetical protein
MGSAANLLLEPHAALAPLFDQQHFFPTASSGPRGRAGRWMRRVARAVLRPWFERQTRFNQQLIDVLASFIREMDRRQQLLDERMAQLIQHFDQKLDLRDVQVQSRIADGPYQANQTTREVVDTLREIEVAHVHRTQAIEARLAEKLESLEQRLQGADRLPCDGRISLGVLDMLFFQTRLPAPPARLFTIGLNDLEVGELTSLGFELAADSHDAAILRGTRPDLERVFAAECSQLRRGARVILSSPDACEDWPAPVGFTRLEIRHAARTQVVLERD